MIDGDTLHYFFFREKYVCSCLFENKRKMSIKNSKSMVQDGVRKIFMLQVKK